MPIFISILSLIFQIQDKTSCYSLKSIIFIYTIYIKQCLTHVTLLLVYFDMYTGFRCCDISFLITTNVSVYFLLIIDRLECKENL